MIYLFDNEDRLIDIIAEDNLIDWIYQVEINAFDEAQFEVPLDYKLDILKEAVYFGFFDHQEEFKVFRITEKSLKDERVIKGLDRAESDLRTVAIIKEKRPKNVTADQALYVALEGTGYEVGKVEGLPMLGKVNFYYISPREALVKIIETWACEFRVRYTFVENRISSRYIDLFKREGRATGKQFYHGDDLLSIEHEESSDDVVTALIGRGKGEEITGEDGQATGGYGRRIEFTDIVWSKSSGKPVDKPAGQNYVVSEVAREKFGLYQNGQLKHRWGVFVDEKIEDKEVLLERTWEELQKLSVPITTYKASLVEIGPDIWKGDSVAIIRDDLGIAFEARIHKLVIDKLNNDRSTVELGDYATLKERHSASRAIQQAIQEALGEQDAQLQAFLIQLEEEKQRKNAEIDEQFRLAQLNMDNALEGVKNEAEKGRAELAQDIEGKLSEQREVAEREQADFVRRLEETAQDLGGVRQNMQALNGQLSQALSAGEQAKTAANQARTKADETASQLLEQARNQTDLVTRVEQIEQLENGSRTNLIQLEKQVDGATGQLAEVIQSQRVSTERLTGLSSQTSALSQTVNSISASVSSLNNNVVRRSELNLDNNGFVTKVGKIVDGRTLATMISQNERDVRIIAEKMKVTGDMLVDGAVTARKLDVASVRAGILTANSITSHMLAADAVTADKLKVDSALIQKLTTDDLLAKSIVAQNAFITAVQAVDLSASRIKGGLLQSLNGATVFNLNNGQLNFYTDAPALRRILQGYPTQFVKFATGTSSGRNVGVTVIGSNRNGTEASNDGGFVGIRAWNGQNDDSIDIVGDTVRLASSAFTDADGWDINTLPGRLNIDAHRAADRVSSLLCVGDVRLWRNASTYISLKDVLHQFNHNFKHLINITGRGDVILTWDSIK